MSERGYAGLGRTDPVISKAKALLPATTDPWKGGWILPDGTMLDLSKGQERRILQHSAIAHAYPRRDPVPYPSEFVADFMGRGAVRLHAEPVRIDDERHAGLWIEFSRQPTRRQLAVIEDLAGGFDVATVEYSKGTGANKMYTYRRWGSPGEERYHPRAIIQWMSQQGQGQPGGVKGPRWRRGLGSPQHITQDAASLKRCSIPARNFEQGQGFILPDGSIISLPAGHQHIVRCLSQDTRDMYARSGRGWSGAVNDAIRAGLIRIVYSPRLGGLWVESTPTPTDAQTITLNSMVQYSRHVNIDVADSSSPDAILRYKIIDEPTPWKVLNFIRGRGLSGRGRLGAQPRVAYPAGTPEGRLKHHWDPYKFKIALRKAEKCGRLAKECHVKADQWGGRPMTTCTWRTSSGKIVAAAASGTTSKGGIHWTSASLWTDRGLLAGRCPEED